MNASSNKQTIFIKAPEHQSQVSRSLSSTKRNPPLIQPKPSERRLNIHQSQQITDATQCSATIIRLLFTIVVYLTLSLLCEFASTYLLPLLTPQSVDTDARTTQSPAAIINAVLQKVKSPPDDVCAICQDSFVDPVRLPCSHVYCDICIRTTLSLGDTCPYCKRNVFRSAPEEAERLRWERIKSKLNMQVGLSISGFFLGIWAAIFAILPIELLAFVLDAIFDLGSYVYEPLESVESGFAVALVIHVSTVFLMAAFLRKFI